MSFESRSPQGKGVPRGLVQLAYFFLLIDLRNASRRTLLGPLWGTVGLAAAIATLGLFFGSILKQEIRGQENYLSSLAVGLIVWSYLSNTANDSCSTVLRWIQVFRHAELPLAALPLSVFMRHTGLLLLNLLLFAVWQSLFFGNLPQALPLALGTLLLAVNALWFSLLLALISIRFRDIGQLVAIFFQIGFFLTPIIWPDYFLGRFSYLHDLNPLYHFVALVRGPLTSAPTPALTWFLSGLLALMGLAAARSAYASKARQMPYWI